MIHIVDCTLIKLFIIMGILNSCHASSLNLVYTDYTIQSPQEGNSDFLTWYLTFKRIYITGLVLDANKLFMGSKQSVNFHYKDQYTYRPVGPFSMPVICQIVISIANFKVILSEPKLS